MSIDPLDWDYNPRIGVPDVPGLFARWQHAAADARAALRCDLDLPYGPGPAQTFDFFPAPASNSPLLIFIHGGYWRALDKKDFAVGALETTAFHRQSELIEEYWPQACRTAVMHLPGCNHFTACEALATPGTLLFSAVRELSGRR